jgi:hypothetical protein
MLLAERSAPAPHDYMYAGSWRACTRRAVYEMSEPFQQEPFKADTLANFRRGNDRERELLIDLARVGRAADPPFEVVAQQQRFELKGKSGRVVIVGKVDARLKCRELGMDAPLEIKAWHPNLVARIKTFEDLFLGTWTRSGAHQLLAYLFGSGEHIGYMLLDRNGLPRLLPVVLEDHLDRMEAFLQKAEEAVAHRLAGTLPDYIDDPTECKRCPFFGFCSPPVKYEGAVVITDDEMLEMLEHRNELMQSGKLFAKLDAEVKARLRGIEYGVAGPFVITGKWERGTTYVMPDEIKERYRKTDPHGRFKLDITKLGGKTATEEDEE